MSVIYNIWTGPYIHKFSIGIPGSDMQAVTLLMTDSDATGIKNYSRVSWLEIMLRQIFKAL